MSHTAFIFARGGSKGVPGKNLQMLAGKPLIGWAVEQALAVEGIARVLVSTDSEELAARAREHGAWVPFLRPAELASDDSPELLSWRHALEYLRQSEGSYPPALISVPPTAPLRRPSDVRACIDAYEASHPDVVLTVTEASTNPYFAMVTVGSDGSIARLMGGSDVPLRRQEAPRAFEVTSVAYVARPSFVMEHLSVLDGRAIAVEVPAARAVDIDTALDLAFAEFLLATGRIQGAGD